MVDLVDWQDLDSISILNRIVQAYVTARNVQDTILNICKKAIARAQITCSIKNEPNIYPVINGCETWTVSKTLSKRLDAFDTWCLRKILRIPHTRHTTNDTVRSITGCLPVSEKVKSFRLRFSGTWLDQLQRRTTTVSSPPRCDHHLIGGDLLVVQDPPG